MKLKDIVLQKGDIVYFKNGTTKEILYSENRKASEYSDIAKIERVVEWETIPKELNPLPVRVVRPIKYETIYEPSKPILTKEEKEYLEAVISPFRDRVLFISKHTFLNRAYEWVKIKLKDEELDIEDFDLPYFKKDIMYKGMELNEEYTLDELGLFKE